MLNTVLALAYSDGSIEFRDRGTMAEKFPSNDFDRVLSIQQVGVAFADDVPC